MNKLLVVVIRISFTLCLFLIFSCSNDDKIIEETNQNTLLTDSISITKTVKSSNDTSNTAIGAQLIKGSDCYSCHKENADLVGPSFIKIGLKYQSNQENIALLTSKVIKGGVGTWGQVPMQAHPTLDPKDVSRMIEYILSVH